MGRPREFDVDQALRAATDLFWRKGYDGTSLQDLTLAMGITPPSFYAAFGNKEALYRRVVEAYQQAQAAIVEAALAQPTAKAVVARLLDGFAGLFADPAGAPGCLIMNSALPVVDGHPFRRLFADQREVFRLELQRRFERAEDLPASLEPEALSRMIVTMIWGFAVEAQSGARREELQRAASAALALFQQSARWAESVGRARTPH